MARVKKGTTALKRRRNVLKSVKGYMNARSTKEKQAKEAIRHAGNHAFDHRRDKKGDFRRLWTININAALAEKGLSYNTFIKSLKNNKIELDRKTLATLAEKQPEIFDSIVEKVK